MKSFLIAYDLSAPGQKYAQISKFIEDNFNYTKPLNTTWIVKSSHSSEELAEALSSFIDDDDKLFIVLLEGGLSRDATWQGLDTSVSNWIQANL